MIHLSWGLGFTGFTAVLVGSLAIARPTKLLESNGASVSAAAVIWMREVGVVIFAQGLTCSLVRSEPLTASLRAVLVLP